MLVSCQSQGPRRKGHNKIGENRTSNRGHRIGSDKIRKGRDSCIFGIKFDVNSHARIRAFRQKESRLFEIIDDSDDTTIGIRGGVLGFLPSTPIEFTKAEGCRRQKEEGGIEVGRGGRGGRRERGGLKTGKLLVNDVVVVVIVVVPTGFQPSLSTRKPSPGCFGLVSFSQEIQSSNKCSRTSLYFNVRRGHRYTSTVVVDEDLLCQNQAVALSLHLPSAGMFEISRFEPRPN
ncbi:hypothetical protein HZH66_001297 [Vespula vulgaris]|uniref:Uncharacterized protein n=1 Tax=Vespula vulgaris TaxID=7454 RepID=A0A834KSU4_VESVU|nr:hypothetical protein HZH66_001297 [Vespula vulgaris]